MFSQLEALGGCIEGARIECIFVRDLDGSVPYESWSVWVTPNEEANPWYIDVAGYATGAATVAGLLALGGDVCEGPFPVTYYELGSLRPKSSVAPEGLTFETRVGAGIVYED